MKQNLLGTGLLNQEAGKGKVIGEVSDIIEHVVVSEPGELFQLLHVQQTGLGAAHNIGVELILMFQDIVCFNDPAVIRGIKIIQSFLYGKIAKWIRAVAYAHVHAAPDSQKCQKCNYPGFSFHPAPFP